MSRRKGIKGNPDAPYYDAGGIQVMDVIKAKLTKEQFKGYLLGNIMKYSQRANFKSSFRRDSAKMKDFSYWLDMVNKEDADEA